jgi:hypothetical protein
MDLQAGVCWLERWFFYDDDAAILGRAKEQLLRTLRLPAPPDVGKAQDVCAGDSGRIVV